MILKILRRLFPAQRERADSVFPHIGGLNTNQRLALAEWLELPATKLALSVIEARRPSPFAHRTGPDTLDPLYSKRAAARLSQLQGWELYRNSLLSLGVQQPAKRDHLEETYPDQ